MKNSSKNKYFAVFIILSFLIYVMSNGEWCVPIFAWIYPILFTSLDKGIQPIVKCDE